MSVFRLRHAEAGDSEAVAEVVVAMETALLGSTGYSLGDLEHEWRTLDLARDAWLVVDDERVVGYGALYDRGELWRIDAYVHPDAFGRGVGMLLASSLEDAAAERGAQRVQNAALEADESAHVLLRSLSYCDVRRFREMRIDLTEPPAPPRWPEGLTADGFDPARDASAFHAAQQEAFADHWENRPRSFEQWSSFHLERPEFDPTLWSVVRAGEEIAAGAINVAGLYGGGWIAVLFTRRPWRRRGLGAALLAEAFGKFWARGERSVGLSVDAESDTGAFRLYERAGMHAEIGWVMFEKEIDAGAG